MKEFDAFSTPIESGGVLIEANAGSGKTFTLEILFLRLILEKGIPLKKILAVTFMKAAASELKDKIQTRLAKLIDRLFAEKDLPDEFKPLFPNPDYSLLLARASSAYEQMDELSVFTIHGFCLKILSEFAFETGFNSDDENIGGGTELIEIACKDVWRKYAYSDRTGETSYFLAYFRTPGQLIAFYKKRLDRDGIVLIPGSSEKKFHDLAREVENNWLELQQEYDRGEIEGFIADNVKKRASFKKNNVSKRLADIESCFNSNCWTILDQLDKCGKEALIEKAGVDPNLIQMPFFGLADSICRVKSELKIRLIHDLKQAVDDRLAEIKIASGTFGYRDLITKLKNTLNERADLAGKIRRTYDAAMIDEFQDTDFSQMDIFGKIFRDPAAFLYFIGDPKQSIYRFRGADVFVYNQAKKTVPAEKHYTLRKNWRSHPDLVKHVNSVFLNVLNPFCFDFINFTESKAAKNEAAHVEFQGKVLKGLRIVTVSNIQEKTEPFEDFAVKEVCGKIRDMLSGECFFVDGTQKKEPVKASDIAVLTLSNDQREAVSDSLDKLGIPSSGGKRSNIFASEEYSELKLIMKTLIERNKINSILSLLAHPIIGKSAEEITAIYKNQQETLKLQESFNSYFSAWKKKGFMTAFRLFSKDFLPESHFLESPSGTTKIINLNHLTEIIATEIENGDNHQPSRTYREFLRFGAKLPEDEIYESRLFSSNAKVRVITVHGSKGLEFPIVFCPFLNKKVISPGRGGEMFELFHDTKSGGYCLDLSVEKNKTREINEILAEQIRLIYVALTRAVNLCFLTLETSKLTGGFVRLFDILPKTTPEQVNEIVKSLLPDCEVKEAEKIESALPPLASEQIHLSNVQPPKTTRVFENRKPFHSFTSLLADNPKHHEFTENKEVGDKTRPKTDEEENTILTFPGGVRAGIFWHSALEILDFQNPESIMREKHFKRLFNTFGFEDKWYPVVGKCLKSLTQVTIASNHGRFTFADIDPRKAIREPEFNLRTSDNFKKALKTAVETSGEIREQYVLEAVNLLEEENLGDYLKGYADLVFEYQDRFYIVDWKSNYLGGLKEDYTPQTIAGEMLKHSYHLQYFIYSLAFNTFQKKFRKDFRIQDNFGGVIYVFLRGLNREENNEDSCLFFDPMTQAHSLIDSFGNEFLKS